MNGQNYHSLKTNIAPTTPASTYHDGDEDDLLDHLQVDDVASEQRLGLQPLHGVQVAEARDEASVARGVGELSSGGRLAPHRAGGAAEPGQWARRAAPHQPVGEKHRKHVPGL